MKLYLVKLLFLTVAGIILNQVNAQSPSFKTYMNPVIPGDHPDATLTRIGNHFYTTGSSFNVTPVIYHSTDLVHWEAISQPVKASWSNYDDKPGGGCWGGQTVLYKGKYWNFFSRANTMYFVKADLPEGPWSDPVKMNNPSTLPYGLGYDNSVFIDDNDKWYLVVKNGQPNNGIVELGDDGQPTGTVYNLTWLNPSPSLPYSWAEGPVMWKFNNYYYYSFARDLSGGQKVMRSPSLTLTADQSSWVMLGDFFNENDPLKPGALFTSPNHASPVVMIDDSTHWIIHPLYAKGEWKGQGRQGLLNQVKYSSTLKPVADYPVNKYFTAPKLPDSGIPWMVPKSDFFNSEKLNPEWSFLGYTEDNTWSLTDRPGWFRLSPKSNKPNTIIKNDGEHNYSLITRFEFDPKSPDDEAGLRIMRGDETKFVKLYSTVNESGQKMIVFSFDNIKYETKNTIGNTLWIKILRVNHSISAYISSNGNDWAQLGQSIDISVVDSYSDFSSFTGTRQGLYVNGSSAFFDLYIYRDAYTPILAECPANQFGTIPTTKTDGIYQLDSIHNNDWALYAGVEFGNDEYSKGPESIEIIASGAGLGGIVEVWLDSIETGRKVAECAITNSGDWNKFETYTAPVDTIRGRHDVYLHFKGNGTGRLFKLKWITFIAKNGPELSSAIIENDDTLQLRLNQPVMKPSLPSGLMAVVNGSDSLAITNISLSGNDSCLLIATLEKGISLTDKLFISYNKGNIRNPAGIGLMPFTDVIADNRLAGAIPDIKKILVNNDGDTVWVYLSKKMVSPASWSGNFTIEIEGKENLSVTSSELYANDSAIIILIPENKIYYEDNVFLTFDGTDFGAANGGILEAFTSKPIQNTANGYPPNLLSATIRKYGLSYKYIDLIFERTVYISTDEKSFFSVTLNDQTVTIVSVSPDSNILTLYINSKIEFGDVIKVSYSGGNVRTLYNGKLPDFTDYLVPNTIISSIKKSKTELTSIKVSPNPAQNKILISSDSFFTSLVVYNMEGAEVLHKNFDFPVLTTNLSFHLKPGVYLLKLMNDKNSGYTKLIIE